MKRMKEQRVLAVVLGIVIVVITVIQILHDGFGSINKTNMKEQLKTNISR
jgi:hypothetical protein